MHAEVRAEGERHASSARPADALVAGVGVVVDGCLERT